MYQEVGEYEKAKQDYEKGLAMTKQIGDRNAEASLYRNLGNLFLFESITRQNNISRKQLPSVKKLVLGKKKKLKELRHGLCILKNLA